MKMSARNRPPGAVTEVIKGEAAARASLKAGDNRVVPLITTESADELGLGAGQQVAAFVVKASDVAIMTDDGVA